MTESLSPSPWSDRQDELRQQPPLTYAAALARIAELEAALEPFARMYEDFFPGWKDHETHWLDCVDFRDPPTFGDIRRARSALRNK